MLKMLGHGSFFIYLHARSSQRRYCFFRLTFLYTLNSKVFSKFEYVYPIHAISPSPSFLSFSICRTVSTTTSEITVPTIQGRNGGCLLGALSSYGFLYQPATRRRDYGRVCGPEFAPSLLN
jgi:hypothetical protein